MLLALESLLIAGLFIYVSSDTITTGYSGSTLTVESTPDFFFVQMLFIIAIVVIGMAMAGMVVFILLSHRIAGPLYRFEKILGQIERGDLTTRVNLRKTDQLIELKDALNMFIGSLDKRMSGIKKNLEEARRLIDKKEDPAAMDKLKKTLELVKEEIGHFKVTSN
jgi:methyl-accepting chemotaxis protein